MYRSVTLLMVLCMCFWACSTTSSDPSALPQDKKTGELTRRDIYELAIATENDISRTHHGDSFGNEASGDLSIYAHENDSKEACGISLIMENKNTEKYISAIIKAKFSIPNNDIHELKRLYQLKPGQAVAIGASHICHQGHSYMIQREIVSATYTKSIDQQQHSESSSDSTKHTS